MGNSLQHSDTSTPLLRTDNQGVTTLTLNRPLKFNTLNEELLAALQTELDDIASNDDIRVVVLAASGKAYCAGHDLKEMRASADENYYQELFKKCSRFMLALINLPQPVIAKVQGISTAAGCQLVATCDMAIASDDARFAVSGINIGLFCSTPSVALSRNISRKRAFEMLFTGDFIDAPTACEWGLINDHVLESELDKRIAEICTSIAAKPVVAVKTGKKMFYKQLEKQLTDAYAYAGDTMACNMMAEDTLEGVDAFIEKREPSWKST